jgi:hypothetical protein
MSKKRQANSPVVGKGKERREDMSGSGSINGEDDGWGLSQDSYLTAASQGSAGSTKPIRKPIFTTKKPEGAFRDEVVIEIKTLNDQPFKGTITPKEARRTIFEEILGFKQEDLIGFYFAYSGCPIVTFKLKEQFNIDSLESFQEFKLERKFKVQNEEKTAILQCKIRGIRTNQNSRTDNYQDEGFRWVKVEGCEYRLEEKQIVDWLSHFGEVKSEISEDTHEGSDDSGDDLPPVGNGIYSVQMKLTRDMPQLIPMHGKRIRLYYRGIIKRCTNCFGTHQRKNCKEEKVPWIKYVEHFISKYPEIPKESYGRWANMIDGMRHERDVDKTIVPVQEVQSTSAEVQSKKAKPATQTTNENDSEVEGEDEQGTEEFTNSSDIQKLNEALAATGISTKDVLKMIEGKKKAKNPGKRATGATGTSKGRGGKARNLKK